VLVRHDRGVELRELSVGGHEDPVTALPTPAEILANPDRDRFLVLESCHSTWLFDTVDRRFCRVLKSARQQSSVVTAWRPYDRLVLQDDSDAFVVFLDASGTRLLRSWRHTAHCDQCGGEVTAEMSLEDLRRVARA
jgi:hypothetical protein